MIISMMVCVPTELPSLYFNVFTLSDSLTMYLNREVQFFNLFSTSPSTKIQNWGFLLILAIAPVDIEGPSKITEPTTSKYFHENDFPPHCKPIWQKYFDVGGCPIEMHYILATRGWTPDRRYRSWLQNSGVNLIGYQNRTDGMWPQNRKST